MSTFRGSDQRSSRELEEAAWPSGQRVGLAIRGSRVLVPPWPLAGLALGRLEFKSSATLVIGSWLPPASWGF